MIKDIINLKSLDAVYKDIYESLDKNKRTVVFSVANTQRLHIISQINKKILFITDTDNTEKARDILTQLGAKACILRAQNDIIVHRHGTSMSLVQQRVSALADWIRGKANILIVTPDVLQQYLPSLTVFKKSIIKIKEGEEINLNELTKKLAVGGYHKEDRAFEKGTFALLGDLIEIFPIDSSLPIRIALDFDVVESIRLFQPETMAGGAKLKSVTIPPSSDFLVDELKADEIMDSIKRARGLQSARAAARTEEILTDIAFKLDSGRYDSLNYLTPFILDKLSTIFDYITKDTIIAFDEPKQILDTLNSFETKHKERVARLILEGEAQKNHINSIISVDKITNTISMDYKSIGFSNFLSGQSDEEKGFYLLNSTNLPRYFKDINLLIKDIHDYFDRGYEIKLFCGNKHWVKTIKRFLSDIDIEFSENRLSNGFISKSTKTLVVGTSEMNIKTADKYSDIPIPDRRSIAPKEGDYVVHDEYGIGKCMGIVHINNYIGEHDYVLLQYADNNKIYVPVHQMDMLHLYSGGEVVPKLSNPNKEDFKKEKEKAKKSIKKLAIDLLELYAKREKSKGYKYPKDTLFQKEFEEDFEFEETQDQLSAINDIKRDMESGRVMDRLICGDVGFGKTEVALRAVFKTIMENKQAAVLAPTTILAEQHFITMSSRFQRFGIKIACLTRFRSKKEMSDIIEGVKNGTISVVVGTHRLLSKDVSFYDLGMLVLDEEQRFGVEHKEKIKALRSNINVLSLSATPIPRTLHMALSGIRDVSVLDIPPKGRHPVKTIVAEYSEGLLVDAVEEEIARGGQVFVLYNRIDRIFSFASTLSRLFPDLKIVVGHGRMSSNELEKNIYKFYNKEADVLLSTTIIENGIDIPNANTLFVLDADRLGLAQMYQLKGRVGRSTRIASAYFTYYSETKVVGNVQKRLDALLDNTELGSGYRLAMMDLEIRGAGNVLGKEQHGHVERIGYDMYCKLLKNTIMLLSGQPVETYSNTEVSIKTNAFISEELIASERERLKLYKRIAEIKSAKDRQTLETDIINMYGKIPYPLNNLLDISLIRALGGSTGVDKVIADHKGARIIFNNEDYLKSAAVRSAFREITKECAAKIEGKELVLCKENISINKKMQLLIKFLSNANGFLY